MKKRIEELERLLGMNSKNSSKPPSSDPPGISLIDGGIAQDSAKGLATLNDPDENWENIGYYIPCDFNYDGTVDFENLAILVSYWLQNEPPMIVDIVPVSGDGVVNFPDFAKFTGNY